MKKKLTLSVEGDLIDQAKGYAQARGKSVSQLVSDYFAALTRPDAEAPGRPGRDRPLPPAVRELAGSLAGDVDETDYYRHLEAKYGGAP